MKTVLFASLALCTAALLSGCADVPVLATTNTGETFRGTIHVSMTEGKFSLSSGKATCSGTYDQWDDSAQVEVPVSCSDGRRGTAIAVRGEGIDGHGTMKLSDGTTAQFIYGSGAGQ